MYSHNKIDFVAFVSVKNANPNGDPLVGNMPRVDRRGHGIMSPECIKRKLRNRLQALGANICYQANDRATDGHTSVQSRVEALAGKAGSSLADTAAYRQLLCETYCDNRLFGGVFAWDGKRSKKSADGDGKTGVSIGITGAVSVSNAVSVDPVIVESNQITKSLNGAESDKRGSDTMGMRHYVEYGLYRIEGSLSAELAEKNGVTDDDIGLLQRALATLCVGDESAARPSGSMCVLRAYWCEHDTKLGVNSRRVREAIVCRQCCASDELPVDDSDYEFSVGVVPGVTIIELDCY